MSDHASAGQPLIFKGVMLVLPTTLMSQAVTFYEQLGFKTFHQDDDYVISRHNTAEVHEWISVEPTFAEKNSSCRIQMRNTEALNKKFLAKVLPEPDVTMSVKP